MKYGNSNTKINDAKQFKSEFAVSLHDAMKCGADAPYFRSIELFQSEKSDQIECELAAHVPQRPVCDIKDWEPVRFVIPHTKRDSIRVKAIRSTFPRRLIHTNFTAPNKPVDICYSEDGRDEEILSLTPEKLLMYVRKWFEHQAFGTLHLEDQPLEPYFMSSFTVVYNKRILEKLGITNIWSYKVDNYTFLVDSIDKNYVPNETTLEKDSFAVVQAKPVVHKDVKLLCISVSEFLNQLQFEDGFDVYDYIYSSLLNRHVVNKWNPICNLAIKLPLKRDSESAPEKIVSYYCTILADPFNDKLYSRLNLILKKSNKEKKCLSSAERVVLKQFIHPCIIQISDMQEDFNSKLAATCNGFSEDDKNQYSIIGVGALGSQIMNTLARMGKGKWNMFDNDILNPHNLARHALSRDAIGESKAKALAIELNKLVKHNVYTPHAENIHSLSKQQLQQKLSTSKVIVDCSTKISVARMLAHDLPESITARCLSCFVNPTGTELIMLGEDSTRTISLDLIEMEYYWYIWANHDLHTHLKLPEGKLRYARSSCRDITSHIRQDHLGMYANIAANQFIQYIQKVSETLASIWRMNEDNMEIQLHQLPINKWSSFTLGQWNIKLSHRLCKDLMKLRSHDLPKENGGCLVGKFDTNRKNLYIVGHLDKPEGSIATKTSFTRGALEKDVLKNLDKIATLEFLGDWHSHTGFSHSMSEADKELHREQMDAQALDGLPATMIIVSEKGLRVIVDNKEYEINKDVYING